MNINLNPNDVILVRNSRVERWNTVVFHSYDTCYVDQMRCVDGTGERWTEWVPLKGNEHLQGTSLPADGWKRGDMCLYKDSDGIRKLGFFAKIDKHGLAAVSYRPLTIIESDDVTFNTSLESLARPEEEWPWWDASLYSETFDNCISSHVVPV